MKGTTRIRFVTCALMGGARLIELAISSRNIRRHAPGTEGRGTRLTYPLVVGLHTTVIGLTALRGSAQPSLPWLALLAAVQPLRFWVLCLLGERWNARAAVPAELHIETRGPYRLVRHPNYAVVIIELLALPMAFRLPRLATVAAFTNAALLAVRIREEEAALLRRPGYGEHFASKARFLPRIL